MRTLAWCFAAAAALMGITISASAGPDCPIVNIVNGTRTTMIALQIREAPRGVWQEVLRGTPLGVQRSKPFCLSQGRYYDIRADFQGGLHVEKPNQPLGGRAAYVLTEY